MSNLTTIAAQAAANGTCATETGSMDIFEMFFGILVLSFIVERFFEIVSSIIDYKWAGGDEKKSFLFGRLEIKTDIVEEKAKELSQIKKLLFTPIGLLIGLAIVQTAGASNCGILHCTNILCTGEHEMLDTFLTAIAISWGTGPIHSFMDILQKASKS